MQIKADNLEKSLMNNNKTKIIINYLEMEQISFSLHVYICIYVCVYVYSIQ